MTIRNLLLLNCRFLAEAGSRAKPALAPAWVARQAFLAGALLIALCGARGNAAQFETIGYLTQSVNNQSSTIDSYDHSDPFQSGGGIHYDNFGPGAPSFHMEAESIADKYGLKSHSFSQMIKDTQGGGGFVKSLTASSVAIGIYQDFTVSGPAGSPTTSFKMNLDGSIIAASADNPGNGSSATSSVSVSVYVNGDNVGGGFANYYSHNGAPAVINAGGVLANWSPIASTFSSPTFTVPANVPFQMEIILQTSASFDAWYPSAVLLEANSFFGHTLTFAQGGPLFNLPAGYTVNSSDAGIVDNSYVVPEPSTFVLAGVGVLGFILARGARRRAKSLLTFGLLALTTAATAEATTFTIDSTRSYLTAAPTFNNSPLEAALPGSLLDTLEGTLVAEIGPNSIVFGGGSQIDFQTKPGPFLPGLSPADYGADYPSTLIPTLQAAMREGSMDVQAGGLLRPDGTFSLDIYRFAFLAGRVDIGGIFGTGSQDLTANPFQSFPETDGSYSIIDNVATLIVPVFGGPSIFLAGVGAIEVIFTGQIVATAIVPEPNGVTLLFGALCGLIFWSRRNGACQAMTSYLLQPRRFA